MITRNRILFIIGIWNVLLPFLGFPSSFRTFFIIVSGLAVILLAFLYARDKRVAEIHNAGPKREVVTEGYAENRPLRPNFHQENHQDNFSQPHQNSTPVSTPTQTPTPASAPTPTRIFPRNEERFTDLKSIINRTNINRTKTF